MKFFLKNSSFPYPPNGIVEIDYDLSISLKNRGGERQFQKILKRRLSYQKKSGRSIFPDTGILAGPSK